MAKFIRKLAVAVTIALIASAGAGCTSKTQKTGGSGGKVAASTYPLSSPVTLTVWTPVSTALSSQYPDQSELPKYKELQKETNITVKLIAPSSGSEKDQFNVMVNSGNLPDIIANLVTVGGYYNGGLEKLYSDGIIRKLNDLQSKYAPDLTKILSACKDVDAFAKDSDGNYLSVPFIRGQSWQVTYQGPIVRKDWLTKLNLSEPETMDDWENILTQFKTKMGATAPLLVNWSSGLGGVGTAFIGAYGINSGYYLDNGKVKYGPAESAYYDFLTEMAKWYKAGLIDPEAATENSKTYDAKAMSNKAGAFVANVGGGMGRYMQGMTKTDSAYQLEGVQYPVVKKGATNKFYQTGSMVWNEAAITTKCKNPEAAMALFNYGYTKKGYMLFNFGIEGTSYTWQNGAPTFTDAVTKDPTGLAFSDAASKYEFVVGDSWAAQDPREVLQYTSASYQQDALKTWTKFANSIKPGDSYWLKGTLTTEETSSIASSQSQIDTYANEMFLKFVEGQQPLTQSSFNSYVSQLKSLGLDNCIKVRQTADDRFNKANPDYFKMSKPSDVFSMFYKDIKSSD